MTTRQRVELLAIELGVAVEWCGENSIDAWSPAGKVFAATGTHCVVAARSAHGDDIPAAMLWRLILDDLEAGLDDCTVDDCDICAE